MINYFKNVFIEFPDKPIDLAHVYIIPALYEFSIGSINNILLDWDGLGQCGAYCRLDALPEESTTSVEFVGLQQDTAYVWHVHMRNCDSYCLIVLANLIVDAGYIWNPDLEIIESLYNRIQISAAPNGQKLQQYDFNNAGFAFKDYQYPQFAEILRSLVIFEGTSSVKAFRRVIIEFCNSSAESLLDQIKEKIVLWGKVIENGYPRSLEDHYTGDGAIQGVSVDIFDENSLEIKVETWGGSESAWNALINLLGIFRSKIYYIKIY